MAFDSFPLVFSSLGTAISINTTTIPKEAEAQTTVVRGSQRSRFRPETAQPNTDFGFITLTLQSS